MTGRLCGNRGSLVIAALCLVACSTYDDSLLATLNSAEPSAGSGGGSSSGAAGLLASGGEPDVGGGHDEAGAGGAPDAGAGNEPSVGGGGGGVTGAPVGSSGGGTAGMLGGGTSGGGVGGGVVGGTTSGGGGNSGLLDDFDDRDDLLSPIANRNGSWYVFSDTTKGTLNPFKIELVSGDNYALHFTASGFTGWGVGVGVDLMKAGINKVVYDVSAYRGIRFSARLGVAAAQKTMKVLFPTSYSDPVGKHCDDSVVTPPGQPSVACSDHYTATIFPLTTSWAPYQVLFSDLRQQGFGLVQSKFDPTTVYSIQFTLATATQPADLWLDDLWFIPK